MFSLFRRASISAARAVKAAITPASVSSTFESAVTGVSPWVAAAVGSGTVSWRMLKTAVVRAGTVNVPLAGSYVESRTSGSCVGPILPIEITGTIETNGPTEVRWRFETQQGGAMPNQSSTFDTFGDREFTVEYTPTLTAGTYWVRLIVTGPNNIQAETTYRIECP